MTGRAIDRIAGIGGIASEVGAMIPGKEKGGVSPTTFGSMLSIGSRTSGTMLTGLLRTDGRFNGGSEFVFGTSPDG